MNRRLTPKEETRINYAIRDRIMHFSPTISPAPKDMDSGEIESIRSAINYYKENGVEKIILQPKYMGSYCDLYLAKDIDKSRFFSRKGYPIMPNRISHFDLVKAAYPIWSKFDWSEIEYILIQAELIPWSVLGKGLIERDFVGYQICHQSHLDYIRNTNLKKDISVLVDNKFKEYLKDHSLLTKKQLNDKYPHHIIKQYEALRVISFPDLDEYQESIDLYKSQIDIYGKGGDPEFKAFNILKVIYSDGKEQINESNVYGFSKVSEDNYLELDIGKEIKECDIDKAYKFFNDFVNKNGEGIIIKPDKIWNPQIVPMFKVRNNNYLQMIYGVNFNKDYDYYLNKRRIGKKMKCSINEWNISQSLLRIPMKEISKDNDEYIKLVSKRIIEEGYEVKLDKRL